ncbi:MAG: 4Fe-4S dicluster domain-containing protein [Planctomycetes bacterium]|nr:4Fe-4S dicluster domain-containing protein [Planctomycetota bacterium]
MKYGFILDHTRCIGCHACTIACKSENAVPTGVFRTWVKYIEKGQFPDTRRYFGVMRCNHCEDAPCIEICPTLSLYKRNDGIVDFDNSRCIGCKSCMQACPYDAIYMEPYDNTAAKCNFCVHRIEQNLEPACVIVCPTQAIVVGDLDDKNSRISKMVVSDTLKVRKPEKNTRPQVFYKGVMEELIEPDQNIQDHSSMMTQRKDGDVVELDQTRITYQVEHPKPWGIKIALYLWTKSIAAGALLIPALLTDLNDEVSMKLAPAISLIFMVITGLLLVLDLKRPERFWFILLKPNFKSWLVLGSYIILLYGILNCMWLYCGLNGFTAELRLLRIPTAAAAIMTACYSAFLFKQAKGRDLWLNNFLFIHLLVAALLAGSCLMMFSNMAIGTQYTQWFNLKCALSIVYVLICLSDLKRHTSQQVRHSLPHLFNLKFFIIVFTLGLITPVSTWFLHHFITESTLLALFAGMGALIAMLEYERLWIKAGQSVPLS